MKYANPKSDWFVIISGQEPGHEILQAVVTLVKNLSEVLTNSLPVFWKVAKGYGDKDKDKGVRSKVVIRFSRSYYGVTDPMIISLVQPLLLVQAEH